MGGDECGEDKVRVLLIVYALCGIRFAGFLWRSVLAVELQKTGLEPMLTDPNVWIGVAMMTYGYKYYEMILFNVDYIIIIYH